MEWSQLKSREKTVIMLFAGAIFFGTYMKMVVQPISKKVAFYKSQMRNSEMQLKDLETKKPQDAMVSTNIKDLEGDEVKLAKEIDALERKMPSQFNTSELVGEVTRLAKEVKLESVKQRIAKDQSYTRIFLEIKFYSTYTDAIQYMAEIESISPFIRVEELEILEPVGKTVELGGAPVKLVVSCLLAESTPNHALKPEKIGDIKLKRDILSSSAKPAEAMDDQKFVLEGITFDARNPTAIINGDVFANGAEMGPYKVKKILQDSVVLSDGVEDHILSLRPTEEGKKK